jgi:hypothetical protein
MYIEHVDTIKKIPDGVIGNFHLHNFSCLTVALGLIQPLTKMSSRSISWEIIAADV